MAAFLTLYDQQNSHLSQLKSSGVDAGYIQLYTAVLNESQAVANAGDVTDAISHA